MFQVGKTLVSEDILRKEFACNLSACKGACCVAGDAGAPLDKGEEEKLNEVYPVVKKYMRPEGIAAIDKQGTYVQSDFEQGELETPLVEGKECAYVFFDERKTALCSIEAAYRNNEIDWKKPISCELYPVRVRQYSEFSAINYDQWNICNPACLLGKELEIPVYRFTKNALVRKFGEDWYKELTLVAENYPSYKDQKNTSSS
jgi:hypothetical protein